MTFNLETFLTAAKDRADRNMRLRQRRAKYDTYMQSLVWAGIRRRKLERSHYQCEQCGTSKRMVQARRAPRGGVRRACVLPDLRATAGADRHS